MFVNEDKHFSNSSSSSWVGMSIVVAEGSCELRVDPLEITTGFLVKWNGLFLVDGLAAGIDRGAIAVGKVGADFEDEPFSALVFPLLARGVATSRVSNNPFLLSFTKASPQVGSYFFFFSDYMWNNAVKSLTMLNIV